MKLFNDFRNWWNQFWFQADGRKQLAFMRIILCFGFLQLYIPRLWQLHYFSDSSIVPREQALNIFMEYYRPTFSFYLWPDSWALMMTILMLGLILLLMLGVGGRFLGLLLWFIDVAFQHRNISICFGADYIGSLLLLYLALSNNQDHLTIRRKIKPHSLISQQLSSIMYRMLQIQISVIYAYTGFEKLKGATWWDGTALWNVLANYQITIVSFEWLRYIPLFIVFISLLTIVFEIYFPLAMLIPRLRYPWLVMGFLFHFGIALMLGLTTFSTVMISTYSLFLSDTLLDKFMSYFDKAGYETLLKSRLRRK